MPRAEFWESLKPKLGAAALLLGIFVAGAFTGAAIYRSAVLEHGVFPPHKPYTGRLAMFSDAMNLTGEQQRRVSEVFEKHRPELDAVVRETFPRVRAVQDKIDAEVRLLLNETQRRRFDEFKERTRNGPFPGGPPGHGPMLPPPFGMPPPGSRAFPAEPPGFPGAPPGFPAEPPGFSAEPPGFSAEPPGSPAAPAGARARQEPAPSPAATAAPSPAKP